MRLTSKWTLISLLTCGLVLISASLLRVQADDNQRALDESRVQIGFEIAPVPLNLKGKNRELVGLGSYLVNGVNDCNACHNGGAPPNFEYLDGHNPYAGQSKKFDPSVYLAGGQDFGQIGPDPSPHIITRNLTPDRTGLPEGGHTFEEFVEIIRTGKDFDHLHPNCSATVTTNCFPADSGINGDLLQIMPWPYYQGMSDHDLRAIYEYLSAIPCIAGPPAPNPLHNDCE